MPARNHRRRSRVANVLTVSSALVLCLAVGMWARSYALTENWSVTFKSQDIEVFSHAGALYVGAIAGWGTPHGLIHRPEGPKGWSAWGDEADHLLAKGRPLVPSFVRGSLRNDGMHLFWLIIAPYWLFAALGVVSPSVWVLRRWKHMRRRRAGLCLRCGYDLTGSEARCPECGTRFSQSR